MHLTVLTADQILDQAHLVGELCDVLKEKGRCTYALEDEKDGKVCIIGALQIARERRGEKVRNEWGSLGYPSHFGPCPLALQLLFSTAGQHLTTDNHGSAYLAMEIGVYKHGDAIQFDEDVYEWCERAQQLGEAMSKVAHEGNGLMVPTIN